MRRDGLESRHDVVRMRMQDVMAVRMGRRRVAGVYDEVRWYHMVPV
jgi:hypothetical protein